MPNPQWNEYNLYQDRDAQEELPRVTPGLLLLQSIATMNQSSQTALLTSIHASLSLVMRSMPTLTPASSLGRALEMLRFHAASSLPIASDGKLAGWIDQSDLQAALAPFAEDVDVAMSHPVAEILRPCPLFVRPEMSLIEIRALLHRGKIAPMQCLPVVDSHGYCLGMVHPCDLLLPQPPQYRLPTIGGMATPFGVYLTDGSSQAGAGNLGLIGTGAMMALMIFAGSFVTQEGLSLTAQLLHLNHSPLFDLDYLPSSRNIPLAIACSAIKILAALPFLLMMRFSVLAGYHAAEHQTVHAIECSEPLVPAVVARMPRAHPRCGTNLVAAIGIFFLFKGLFDSLLQEGELAMVSAGLITLFTWKRVGTFLQERFTTRQATERQLASGIKAGNELIMKSIESRPARRNPLRRFWCMGMAQSLLGMLLISGIISGATYLWEQVSRH